jgi:hypothetical protein
LHSSSETFVPQIQQVFEAFKGVATASPAKRKESDCESVATEKNIARVRNEHIYVRYRTYGAFLLLSRFFREPVPKRTDNFADMREAIGMSLKKTPRRPKYLQVTAEDAALMSPYVLDGRVAEEVLANQRKKPKPRKRKTKS